MVGIGSTAYLRYVLNQLDSKFYPIVSTTQHLGILGGAKSPGKPLLDVPAPALPVFVKIIV